MNVKTKFNIGDSAYIIRSRIESYRDDCAACKGTGKVHIQETGDEIECPTCHGDGYKVKLDSYLHKEECKVSKISTVTTETETIVVYDLLMSDNRLIHVKDDMVFTSKEADKQVSTNNSYAVYRQSFDPMVGFISATNVSAAVSDTTNDKAEPRKKLF